jgi:hypothetical protein
MERESRIAQILLLILVVLATVPVVFGQNLPTITDKDIVVIDTINIDRPAIALLTRNNGNFISFYFDQSKTDDLKSWKKKINSMEFYYSGSSLIYGSHISQCACNDTGKYQNRKFLIIPFEKESLRFVLLKVKVAIYIRQTQTVDGHVILGDNRQEFIYVAVPVCEQ